MLLLIKEEEKRLRFDSDKVTLTANIANNKTAARESESCQTCLMKTTAKSVARNVSSWKANFFFMFVVFMVCFVGKTHCFSSSCSSFPPTTN